MIPKRVGGLSLTTPEDAMRPLMRMDHTSTPPRQSNLQLLLRYCITQLQSLVMTLGPIFSLVVLFWSLYPRHIKSLHHIAQSWKVMAQIVVFLSPSCVEDILQLNFWWMMEY